MDFMDDQASVGSESVVLVDRSNSARLRKGSGHAQGGGGGGGPTAFDPEHPKSPRPKPKALAGDYAGLQSRGSKKVYYML